MIYLPDLIRRSREVVATLVRHGLGSLASELRLRRWPGIFVPWRHRAAELDLPTHARRLRLAIEEMGATFVKVGQILSTRPDLLPGEVIAELTRLQDAAPPSPWPEVSRQLERELGRPLEQAFASLDSEPFAAASLGQVHAGVLPEGQLVAVKVLRPGVERQVELDIAVLRRLGALAGRNEALAAWQPERLVEELGRSLRSELDYGRERRNLQRFGHQLAGVANVRVPQVFPDWCTRRVLTMERIEGVRIDDLGGLAELGVDRGALARRMAAVLFRSALQHGFFHADPHPGNFRVLGDGTLVLLDFGMMGYVPERQRGVLLELLLAIVSGDADRCVDRLADLGLRVDGEDETFRRELALLLFDYADLPFGELPMGDVLAKLLELARSQQLRLPPELALLAKTVVMAEGLGLGLDPGFQLATVARPVVRRVLVERLRPRGGDRLRRSALDLMSLAEQLPARTRRLSARLDRGDVQVEVRLDQRAFVHELERLVRNLRVSALSAAAIVALGLLTLAYPPATLQRWAPWLFGAGALVTLGLLGYLVLDSWRSRRL